jgi:transcriptional regulator NrdR family protein
MARGPGRFGFRCPCGGVIRVRRTQTVKDGVLVRNRSCNDCSRTFKSVETLVDVVPHRSVIKIARAIRRLLVD